jgi:hypothetical protein
MKSISGRNIVLLFLLFSSDVFCQESDGKITHFWKQTIAKLKPTPWFVGLGFNLVDDDGNPSGNIVTGKSLNVVPYISTATFEKYIAHGWSADVFLAYNHFRPGQVINSNEQRGASDFFCLDINGKYNFCSLFDLNAKWFKFNREVFVMYGVSGFGYTYRNTPRVKDATNLNVGFGADVWLSPRWGFNMQGMRKFGLKSPLLRTPYNYLQYSFGVIYRFMPTLENARF